MSEIFNNAIDSTGLLSKSQKVIVKYILSFGLNKGLTSNSIHQIENRESIEM